MSCPASPTVGQLGNRNQSPQLIAITDVDAQDISDGEIMIRSFEHPDLIARTQLTLRDNSQAGPGSQRLAKVAWKQLVIHPNCKPPAGDPRPGNLENRRSDLPTLSDQRVVHLDPFGGEILAKLAVRKRAADLLFPPAKVFDRVSIHGLVGSAVYLAIRLVVAVEIYTSSGDPTDNRRFPDSAPGWATIVLELARLPDIDREYFSDGARH